MPTVLRSGQRPVGKSQALILRTRTQPPSGGSHIQKVGLLGVLGPGYLGAPISLNTDALNTRSTTVWKPVHIRKVPQGKQQILEETSGPTWTAAAAIPSVHPHGNPGLPPPNVRKQRSL